jgi:hypothetical protein
MKIVYAFLAEEVFLCDGYVAEVKVYGLVGLEVEVTCSANEGFVLSRLYEIFLLVGEKVVGENVVVLIDQEISATGDHCNVQKIDLVPTFGFLEANVNQSPLLVDEKMVLARLTDQNGEAEQLKLAKRSLRVNSFRVLGLEVSKGYLLGGVEFPLDCFEVETQNDSLAHDHFRLLPRDDYLAVAHVSLQQPHQLLSNFNLLQLVLDDVEGIEHLQHQLGTLIFNSVLQSHSVRQLRRLSSDEFLHNMRQVLLR